MSLQILTDTFGLIEDPEYQSISKLADTMKPGTWTTQQIFDGLEAQFRKPSDSDEWWFHKANKWLDLLVHYDFLTYKDGYYEIQNNSQP